MTLIEKLAAIRSLASVVSKDKQGYGYTYADITQILAKITAGMKKYGVSLIPSVVSGTANVNTVEIPHTKTDKQGVPHTTTTVESFVTAEMIFRWVNNEKPDDYIEVSWFMTGSQSDPSQAFGSGLSYCTRYFLTNYFQIAQVDTDVDAYRSKQKEAEASEARAVAEEMIKSFDVILKKFLADNEAKAADLKKFIGKYIKGSNYFNIKDPELAGELIQGFRETFLEKPKTTTKKKETK